MIMVHSHSKQRDRIRSHPSQVFEKIFHFKGKSKTFFYMQQVQAIGANFK